MKPGLKTSEFWLTVVALILEVLGKSGVLPVDFPLEAVGIVAAYVLSRGLAKFLIVKT